MKFNIMFVDDLISVLKSLQWLLKDESLVFKRTLSTSEIANTYNNDIDGSRGGRND